MSGLLLAAPPAAAAAGCNTTTPTLGQTVTCTTYGTESITVPSGAGSVSVVAIGGGGGGGAAGNNVARAGSGGGGAVVTATFALGQGTSALSIRVGGGGGAGQNYWHYGAWGGGFSAVSVSGTPLAIAGGGGGGGTGPNGNTGGDGGDGGGIGGVGNNGDDGGNNGAQGGRGGGGAGGPGGAGGAGIPNGGQPFDGTAGAAWSAGGGGGASSSSSYGGGNGGGGYGGGGGGGVDGSLSGGHGGGGAGGSFADATALIGSATYGTATTGAGAPGAGTPAGTTANGSNGVDGQVQLTFNGAPVVTSVSPGNGPVAGGTSIHVDGTDLSGATSVTFGTTSATITANTATRVTVTLPSGFGTKDVSVTTPNGTGTKANAFTYDSPTITGVSPSPISALGGTSMYVDGTNLLYATGVTFGGVAGTITNTTDTRVTVTAPASSVAGAVDVVVMSQGASNVTAVGAVTYTASKPTPPTIGTATAGVRQAAVSWTAPTFDGGSTITGYTVTSNPDSLTCTTTGATTCTVTGLTNLGTYTFTVTATNSVGTSLASSASPSVTLVAPTITHASINPTMGSALGGTQVTITGANLAGASSVTFGGVAGTIQSTTSTTIVVLTPPSNQSTSVDVVVTVNSVTATVQSGFTYTQSGPSAPTNIVAALAGSDGATPTSPAEPTTPNAPTPTTTPTVRPTMPATLAAATIPGLRLPMRITVPGTTILVRQTLRTSDGTVVTARATVQRVAASTTSRALPPAKATGTRIVNGRNGRISVVTTGRYPVVVTLRLTAPATSTSAALRQTKIWRVPAKRQ